MTWVLPFLQAPEWALAGGLVLAALLVWWIVVMLRDLARNAWEERRR